MIRRVSFIPTGDRSYRVSGSLNGYVECLVGFGMMVVSVLTISHCLMAVGLSLALVPILIKKNLAGRLTSILVLSPVLITIAAICGIPILLVGLTGIFTGIALAHH